MTPTASRKRYSRTWLAALGIVFFALLAHLVILNWVRIEPVRHRQIEISEPYISLDQPGQGGDMTREQALLLDSAPLFLPTRWSTASAGEIGQWVARTDFFEAFPQEITLSASNIRPVQVSAYVQTPPLDQIGTGRIVPSLGSDATFDESMKLPLRGAFFEVVRISDGKSVISGSFQQPLPDAIDRLWQPVELWVRIVREGALGEPFLAASSGTEDLDEAIGRLVSHSEAIALLLPGYYCVRVGP